MAASAPKHRNIPLPVGASVGRYRIQNRLSAGGFGVVYSAERVSDGKVVAIKEFMPSVIPCRLKGTKMSIRSPADFARFRDGLSAFFREADVLSRLDHPQVIEVWDVFEANGTAYFTMPMERGSTVQSLLRRSRSGIQDDVLISVFRQAAQGLSGLHSAGLLHLDVKPPNLWIRPDGAVVVLDLGASRWTDEEGRMAHMARTPGFAAPEQHGPRSGRLLVPATDVYGLGATMYTCIEREPPPSAPDRFESVTRQEAGARPRQLDRSLFSLRVGQHSPDLLCVIDRCMRHDPRDRYASMDDLLLDLSRIRRPVAARFTHPESGLV